MLSLVATFEHHGFGWVDVHAPLSLGIEGGTPEAVRVMRFPGSVDLEGVEEPFISRCIDEQFAM
eukprot:1151293-Alexandrium_andersonii.AAC.1